MKSEKQELLNALTCALLHDIKVCETCKKCEGNNAAQIRINLMEKLKEAFGETEPDYSDLFKHSVEVNEDNIVINHIDKWFETGDFIKTEPADDKIYWNKMFGDIRTDETLNETKEYKND